MKLAKIRHRIMATILDNLIIIASMVIFFFITGIEFLYAIYNELPIEVMMIDTLVRAGMFYALFLLSYYMIVPMFIKGQTIGKWFFKIKVVSDDGKDVDYKVLFFREAICRILLRTLSMGISSFVSIMIMMIRDDKKSVADVFAKTSVIDIKGVK